MAGHNNNERSQSGHLSAPNLFMTPPPDLHLQPPPNTHHDNDGGENEDGAPSAEHRARGRPPGSKNKPKAPVMVMRESPYSLHSQVLEVSDGADVVDSLVTYTRQWERGITILSGNGMVSHVNLRQPGGTSVTLNGRFQILSISGTLLPRPMLPGVEGLSVYLSGGQGQVVGGIVLPPLLALGPVFLMTASFSNTVFERLPLVSEDQQQEQQQPHSSTSHSPGVTTVRAEGGGGGAPFFRNRNIQFSSSSSSAAVPDGNLFGWGASNTTGRN